MKNNIKELFQKEMKNFAVRYQNPTIIDNIFRKSIFLRFERVILECRKFEYKTVLDIGWGYGIQALTLAKEGLDVVGIDFSKNMINHAKDLSDSIFLKGKIEFKVADFLEYESEKKFDLVIALGVFDYIARPLEYLNKMKQFASKEIIASFPATEDTLFLQRKIRYRLFKHCNIFSYSGENLEKLTLRCGITDYRIERIARDYLFYAYLNE